MAEPKPDQISELYEISLGEDIKGPYVTLLNKDKEAFKRKIEYPDGSNKEELNRKLRQALNPNFSIQEFRQALEDLNIKLLTESRDQATAPIALGGVYTEG